MKKIPLITLLAILLSSAGIKAQLMFCGNYTDAGEPMEVSERWTLGEKGGYIYIFYSNKNKVIRSKTLNVHVKRLIGKSFLDYDNKPMDIQDKKTWGVIDYHFTEPGSYEVFIQESNGRELAKNFLNIYFKGSKDQPTDDSPDQSYYNATITFCTSITDNQPQGIGKYFTTGTLNIFLQNDKPLLTDSMIVKYFKRHKAGDSYQPSDVVKYGVTSGLNHTYFENNFKTGGEYLVEIYNSRFARMASATVTITGKSGDYKDDPDQSYYNTTVSFCESIDKKDKPVGVKTSFNPGTVYIYVMNDKPLLSDSMNVMIYKRAPGSETYDQYYNSKKYGITSTLNGTYFSLQFDDPGEYSVEVYNRAFAKMGVNYLKIKGKDNSDAEKDPDRSYYNATITFCENVVDGYEKNIGTSFKTGEVFIVLRNDKALSTDSIIVDVQKKAFESNDYNIFINSTNYGISPISKNTYFSLEFKEQGQFRVDIFNRRMQKISEGYVTIL